MSTSKGPILIEIKEDVPAQVTPSSAPAVPELSARPEPSGQAMQTLAAVAGRKPSKAARFLWQTLVALVGFGASVAAYDFVAKLLERSPILGGIAFALVMVFLLALLIVAGKEWLALGRLKRIDTLRADAEAAINNSDLKAAHIVNSQVLSLYAGRPELGAGRQTLNTRVKEAFDADAVLGLTERHLLTSLDQAALLEVETAARHVATVTAIVPLALTDLAAALTSNLRMIRRIAEIYGGRSGTLGSWRLTRAVFAHLVATGAVAIGDDLIGSIAGGGVLSKLSRRFGEGMINGALTARVGVAAIEVCRPLPFAQLQRPSVTKIIKNALVGLIPGQ
ncbi:MAG: TIGR01620 family protein [Litoreibacter sp.]